MNFAMIWPIALIILANVFYHVSTKEIPSTVNPFASLTITYLVGAVASGILYFVLSKGGNIIAEYKNVNWSSFVLGLAIVGLEAGSIYMYKAGWNISSGELVYSILLAICLCVIGIVAYHEHLTASKIAGIVICLVGLFLINK